MPEVNACWCGETEREPLGSGYDRCSACGCLVYAGPIELERYLEPEAPDAFYGPRYWRQYVPEVLDLPGLDERARSDFVDRAPFYLRRIVEHVSPGSDVLEIGCARGALGYLVSRVGMNVVGIELGGEAAEFVRRTFALEVLDGPLERLDVQRRFAAVVMIDVLEHLPLPLATLEACRALLQPGGVLVLQTPRYRDEGAEWPMLLPEEHLFLHTEASLGELLRQAGFSAIEVTGSLFPHDMWAVAAVEPELDRRPDSLAGLDPLAVALIESAERLAAGAEARDAIDRDRAAKDGVIEELSARLEEAHADQGAKLVLIEAVTEEIEAVRADQAEKEVAIARLTGEIAEVRADQAEKEAAIVSLTGEIGEVRADQAEKEAAIASLTGEIGEVRADQVEKEALIASLTVEIEEVRADQDEKQALIASLTEEIGALRGDQGDKEALIVTLTGELEETRADQADKQALIARVSKQLEEVRADQRAKEELIVKVSAELEEVRADQRAKEELIARLTE